MKLKNGDIVFMQRIMMREKPLFRPFSQKFLEEKGIGSKVEYMSMEDYKLTNIGK